MKIKLLILSSLILLLAFQTDRHYTIISSHEIAISDKLGNIYVVKKDELIKYKDGLAIKVFSKKTLGPISSLDVSNPLRLLLFYKNSNKITFLDNQLSENSGIIDLFQLLNVSPLLLCNSSNNQFWLFDQNNTELLKVKLDLSISNRTGNLNNQIESNINPNAMREINNQLFLNDPSKGVFIFDYFGTLIKKIPIKNVAQFDVVNNELIYSVLKQKQLYKYNMKSFETSPIDSCMSCDRIYFTFPYSFQELGDSLYIQNIKL
jgi:hypothetical protein